MPNRSKTLGMLTLFTIPKPFAGHIGIIQRNAIRSWTLLCPQCEIILFGDDEGTAEIAAEFEVHHVSDVGRNEYGTPLVNDLFEQAQRLATHDVLCYVNADIILMGDFMRAVEQVARCRRRFLMVGQRWDVELENPLDFGPHWEERLRNRVTQNGWLHSLMGIDYFVFHCGLGGEIPAFAIGRPAWDNWFVYQARVRRVPVINATQVVMAVHQNHDYSHHPEGEEGVWEGPEAERNQQLAGEFASTFSPGDATQLLTPDRLKWAFDRGHLWRHLDTLPILHPSLRIPAHLLLKIIRISRALRARLGPVRFERLSGE